MSARHAGRRRGGEAAREKGREGERRKEGEEEGRKREENKKFECDAGEEIDDGDRRESVTFCSPNNECEHGASRGESALMSSGSYLQRGDIDLNAASLMN